MVAVTLPEDAIDRLHRVHRDLGWAILTLLDQRSPGTMTREGRVQPDVELVSVTDRRSLIVVNREAIRSLPGVNIIPLSGTRAFLALDSGRGMSDLELAVIDRLAEPALGRLERRSLTKLRTHLSAWRRDRDLRFHARAIIVVERLVKRPSDESEESPRESEGARASAKMWARNAKPRHAPREGTVPRASEPVPRRGEVATSMSEGAIGSRQVRLDLT